MVQKTIDADAVVAADVAATSIEDANAAVHAAIAEREQARLALLELENEHPDIIIAWQQAYMADALARDRVKKAMAVAASLQLGVSTMTYVRDKEHGKYGWVRRRDKKVDVRELLKLHPRLLSVHPEIFEVKPKNLDRMVDEGQVSGPSRVTVISEVPGPVIRYVPQYKKGAIKIGSDEEDGGGES